ncbi:MAG: response regulator [Myxococcaceae bacterium]|nr:response regulator [Myxococcaceae bacterium]
MEADVSAPRVIIVDDDRETRNMLATLLQSEGFHVLQAANGLKLISILHADHPDVIVLDVNLSWIDGFELCRSVKANEEYRDIPVVFLSGRTSHEDVERGMSMGAVEYFRKPVDFEAFAARLREIVATRRRAADGS